jgi:hypothetical protein
MLMFLIVKVILIKPSKDTSHQLNCADNVNHPSILIFYNDISDMYDEQLID